MLLNQEANGSVLLALENSLMGHPSVLEAAVIAIPDEKWMERPFAYVVLKEGKTFHADELNEFLAGKFAKFWIPDGYAFIDAIPKTSVGKFLKSALREKYNKEHMQNEESTKSFCSRIQCFSIIDRLVHQVLKYFMCIGNMRSPHLLV